MHGRIGRLLLLSSIAMAFSHANMGGRQISSYEQERRKRNAELAASKKKPLTPKQQKARNKSKLASKSRNKLRKHPNYHKQLKNERASRSTI